MAVLLTKSERETSREIPLFTEGYIYSSTRERIIFNGLYLFGQIWDGRGDGNEILESGTYCMYSEVVKDFIRIEFEIVEEDGDIMQTIIKITDIEKI